MHVLASTPIKDTSILQVVFFTNRNIEYIYIILYQYLVYLLDNIDKIYEMILNSSDFDVEDWISSYDGCYMPPGDANLINPKMISKEELQLFIGTMVKEYTYNTCIITSNIIMDPDSEYTDVYDTVFRCRKIRNHKTLLNRYKFSFVMPLNTMMSEATTEQTYSYDNKGAVNIITIPGNLISDASFHFHICNASSLCVLHYMLHQITKLFPMVRLFYKIRIQMVYIRMVGPNMDNVINGMLSILKNSYSASDIIYHKQKNLIMEDVINKFFYGKKMTYPIGFKINSMWVKIIGNVDKDTINSFANIYNNYIETTPMRDITLSNKIVEHQFGFSSVVVIMKEDLGMDIINTLKNAGYLYMFEPNRINDYIVYLIPCVRPRKLIEKLTPYLKSMKYEIYYSDNKVLLY